MKKYLMLLLITISSQAAFSQSKFSEGFKDGYKEGYCHNQGIGCLAPLPPIAPIPNVGENQNSYQDGYNRGFAQGLNAQKTSSNEDPTPQTRKRYETTSPNFVDDFVYKPNYDLMLKALEQKQEQASANSKRNNYSQKDYEKNTTTIKRILQTIQFTKWEIEPLNLSDKSDLLSILDKYESAINSFEYKYQIANNTKYFDDMYTHIDQIFEYVFYSNESFHYNRSKALALQQEEGIEGIEKRIKNEIDFVVESEKEGKLNKENAEWRITILNYDLLLVQCAQEKWVETIELSTKLINQYEKSINKQSVAYMKQSMGTLYFIRSMSKVENGDYYGSNSDLDYLIDNYKNQTDYYNLATLYNNKAYNFVLLKKYKDAQPLIERALSLDKTKDFIYGTKGELEYHLGNYTESVKATTNAIKLKGTGNSYYYRGLANIKLGRKTEGCKDLSKAGELGERKAFDEIKKNCN